MCYPVYTQTAKFSTKQLIQTIEDKASLSEGSITYKQGYRVLQELNILRWGTPIEQYNNIIPMLESMKAFDPDSVILLKVFADNHVYKTKKRKSNDIQNEGIKQFALRFGAVSITPGSTVRRQKDDETACLLRKVRTLDACHLNSSHRGTCCEMIQPCADSEKLVEFFTADAENESINTWNFSAESYKYAIGNKELEDSVFVCDRLRGQHTTLSRWFPNVDLHDCIFHLKENMRTEGKIQREQLQLFDKYVHSGTVEEAGQAYDNFINSLNPLQSEYVLKSVTSKPERFCDAFISKEREGIRSQQLSESFHSSIIEARECTIPVFLYKVFQYQYKILNDHYKIYDSSAQNNKVLPRRSYAQFVSNLNIQQNYKIQPVDDNLVAADVLIANVLYLMDLTSHKVTVTTTVGSEAIECSHRCLKRNGMLCSYMIAYYLYHLKANNVLDYFPKKFRVDGGLKLLKTSLGQCAGKSYDFNFCRKDNVTNHTRILPPHCRVQSGRPKKKRMVKGQMVKKRTNRLAKVTELNNVSRLYENDHALPANVKRKESSCSTCGEKHSY